MKGRIAKNFCNKVTIEDLWKSLLNMKIEGFEARTVVDVFDFEF